MSIAAVHDSMTPGSFIKTSIFVPYPENFIAGFSFSESRYSVNKKNNMHGYYICSMCKGLLNIFSHSADEIMEDFIDNVKHIYFIQSRVRH